MKIICSRYNFATTVGIISGHPRFDKQTAQIIDKVQAISKDIQFVGVIGDNYSKKLKQTYASSSILDHDEIVVTRNYYEHAQQAFFNPYRAITHWKNAKLLKTLQGKNFFEDMHSKHVPAVIVVGNYSLMNRTFKRLNKVYEDKNTEIPLRLGFDNMITFRELDNQKLVDFIYCNMPRLAQINLTGYVFPSLCIGYEGLFKAFQFLQKQRGNQENGFTNKQFSIEVNELCRKARSSYRKQKNYTEDQYLTLFAPGNTQKQIKFSFSQFVGALKVFHNQQSIKNVAKGFFKILVLTPEDQKIADFIKSKVSSLSDYEVVFVPESQKYAAMCASDFGVLHNGQVTVQTAACQLPALVINSMSNYHAYISYLYNGHESPLNVSTNYQAYQQLLGSWTAIPRKISSIMLDHFNNPKLRYEYMRLYRGQIQKMLSVGGRNPTMNPSKTGLQWAAEDIVNKIHLKQQLKNTTPLKRLQRKERLALL